MAQTLTPAKKIAEIYLQYLHLFPSLVGYLHLHQVAQEQQLLIEGFPQGAQYSRLLTIAFLQFLAKDPGHLYKSVPPVMIPFPRPHLVKDPRNHCRSTYGWW